MRKLMLLMTAFALAVTVGCKKDGVDNETGSISDDNKNIQSQTDDAVSDANTAISENSLLSGKTIPAEAAKIMSVCGASLDTTQRPQGIITINYDGVTVCNNRKRSGAIRLTLQDYTNGKRWKDSGAVLKVDYLSYKVTRASDGKFLQFDGTHAITNNNGGNLVLLVFGMQSSVVNTVSGSDLKVTFHDGSVSHWNINRRYTYTWASNVLTCKGEGLGTQNGLSNLENWGTTREGDNFTSQVLVPVIWNTTCGAHAPVEGKLDIRVDSKEFELIVTLGVDKNGNPVAVTPNFCPYGLKVEWTHKKKTNSRIFAYL